MFKSPGWKGAGLIITRMAVLLLHDYYRRGGGKSKKGDNPEKGETFEKLGGPARSEGPSQPKKGSLWKGGKFVVGEEKLTKTFPMFSGNTTKTPRAGGAVEN